MGVLGLVRVCRVLSTGWMERGILLRQLVSTQCWGANGDIQMHQATRSAQDCAHQVDL